MKRTPKQQRIRRVQAKWNRLHKRTHCKVCNKKLVGRDQIQTCGRKCACVLAVRSPDRSRKIRRGVKRKWKDPIYRKKMSDVHQSITGVDRYNWKGGQPNAPRNSAIWRRVTREAKIRDKRRCLDCNIKPHWLHVHHVDFNPRNHTLENAVTLCPKCHFKRHNKSEVVKKWWRERKDHEQQRNRA